jgi:hypothetical protein
MSYFAGPDSILYWFHLDRAAHTASPITRQRVSTVTPMLRSVAAWCPSASVRLDAARLPAMWLNCSRLSTSSTT